MGIAQSELKVESMKVRIKTIALAGGINTVKTIWSVNNREQDPNYTWLKKSVVGQLPPHISRLGVYAVQHNPIPTTIEEIVGHNID